MKIRELEDGRFKYMSRICAECGYNSDLHQYFDENEAYRCGIQNCIICGINTVNLSTGFIPKGSNAGKEIQRIENFLDEIRNDLKRGLTRAKEIPKGRYACVVGNGDKASWVALTIATQLKDKTESEINIKFGFVNNEVELGKLLVGGNKSEIWIIHLDGTSRMYNKFHKMHSFVKNVRNIIFVTNEDASKAIEYPYLKMMVNDRYDVEHTEVLESLWCDLEAARSQ